MSIDEKKWYRYLETLDEHHPLLTRRHRATSCHPKDDAEWKWQVKEKRRLELPNASNNDGQSEDCAAKLLNNGHDMGAGAFSFLLYGTVSTDRRTRLGVLVDHSSWSEIFLDLFWEGERREGGRATFLLQLLSYLEVDTDNFIHGHLS